MPGARVIGERLKKIGAPIAATLAALALAACGSSTPTSTGTQPMPVQTNSQVTPVQAPSSATSVAATFTWTGNEGDSATATVSIGQPVAEGSLPASVVAAASTGTCMPGTEDLNVAVPVDVTATINSDLSLKFGVDINSDPWGSMANTLTQDFVYPGSGDYCEGGIGNQTGSVTMTLAPGAPQTVDVWVILLGAVTPEYPQGNLAEIAASGITPQIGPGFPTSESWTVTASGPGICTAQPNQTPPLYTPFLLLAGTEPSGLTCNSTYTASQEG